MSVAREGNILDGEQQSRSFHDPTQANQFASAPKDILTKIMNKYNDGRCELVCTRAFLTTCKGMSSGANMHAHMPESSLQAACCCLKLDDTGSIRSQGGHEHKAAFSTAYGTDSLHERGMAPAPWPWPMEVLDASCLEQGQL